MKKIMHLNMLELKQIFRNKFIVFLGIIIIICIYFPNSDPITKFDRLNNSLYQNNISAEYMRYYITLNLLLFVSFFSFYLIYVMGNRFFTIHDSVLISTNISRKQLVLARVIQIVFVAGIGGFLEYICMLICIVEKEIPIDGLFFAKYQLYIIGDILTVSVVGLLLLIITKSKMLSYIPVIIYILSIAFVQNTDNEIVNLVLMPPFYFSEKNYECNNYELIFTCRFGNAFLVTIILIVLSSIICFFYDRKKRII